MMKLSVITVFLLFSFSLFSESLSSYYISPFRECLKDSSHYSDGFVDVFESGVMIHVFRIDPGINGDHVGNTAYIARRFSFDNGNTWTVPSVIFNDSIDDRNITGGVISGNRIVVIFRRYNAVTATHIDVNLIYSDDGGYTWSERRLLNTVGQCTFNQRIFHVPGRGYFLSFYNQNYIELRQSNDGIGWDNIVKTWDYTQVHTYQTSESSFTYLENGIIYGLIRNENTNAFETFLCTISYDYGNTWSPLELTNIADGLFCPSPSMYFDKDTRILWVVTTDRRGVYFPTQVHDSSRVWIYGTYINDLLSNSNIHSHIEDRMRLCMSFYRTYGYHSITKTVNGRIYVNGVECRKRPENFLEHAWFYDFFIDYDYFVSNTMAGVNELFGITNLGPNPFTDEISIGTNKIDGRPVKMLFVLFDENGAVVFEKEITCISGSFTININSEAILPPGIYIAQIICEDRKFTRKLVRA